MSQQTKTNRHLILICISALFAALITVVTAYFPKLPLAVGYVHLGDSLVCLAAAILPLPYSFLACALGGGLADLICGYAVYAPASFAIKGLTALLFRSVLDRSGKVKSIGDREAKIINLRNLIALVPYAVICVGGYFIYELFIYGVESAIPGLLMNFLQSVANAIVFAVFGVILDRVGVLNKLVRMQ